MNTYLMMASALTFITFAIHVFVGGPEIAKPLLEARDIRPVPKYTNYYCWHIVSINLLLMSGGYLYSAQDGHAPDLALFATLSSGAYMMWSLTLIRLKKQSLKWMPQWALFLGITFLGTVGLI